MRHVIRRGFFKPLLAGLGATAGRCYVDVGPESVEVVFGLSRHVIPREQILAAKRLRWPALGGIGWRVAPGGGLGLIGSLEGVVELRLGRRYTHHIVLVPLRFDKLYVSMEDPEALIADLGFGE